ncbi:hypothetical protein [Nesterenkonia halobia]|uniref:Uncharacterized protein n=1 Tax=Nesterenkonia halobia TaxID=37922 RepID=A0ABP6R5X4_9MICC
MAIPTTFDIEYTCGHTETTDLSATPAGKRKGRAFGLGKNLVCSKCFKKKGKEELAKQNQQTLIEAGEQAEALDLPELDGTEKQVDWATRARYEALASIQDDAAEATAAKTIDAAKQLVRAGWWIDNTTDKELDAEDLVELITTAAEDTDWVECENDL